MKKIRAAAFWLIAAFAAAGATPAGGQDDRLESWILRDGTSLAATFQSHYTKVHAIANGAIVSYIRRRGADQINDYAVSYVDYEKRLERELLSGRSGTSAPCIARKADDQFGVFVNDHKSRRVLFDLLWVNPATGDGRVLTSSEVEAGGFGKFACAYDGTNFHFIGNDGVLITVDERGHFKRRQPVFERANGKGISLQYPQILYEDGFLRLAFTTAKSLDEGVRRFIYWSILYVESGDRGLTWTDRAGILVAIPLPPDNMDVAISGLNDGTRNRWLRNIDSIGPHVVAEYSDDATGEEEDAVGGREVMSAWSRAGNSVQALPVELPGDFKGQRQTGVFIEDDNHPEHMYFLTFLGSALAVLKSTDEGRTWKLWFKSDRAFSCPYAVDAARLVTRSGSILGVVTERGKACGGGDRFGNDAAVVAFRLDLSGP